MINWTYIFDKTEDPNRQDFSQFFDDDWGLKDKYLALDEDFILYKKCFWSSEKDDTPTFGYYNRIFYFCLKEEFMNAINDYLIKIPDDSLIHNPYILKDERFKDGYFLFDSPDLIISRSPYYYINEYVESKALYFIKKANYKKLLPKPW